MIAPPEGSVESNHIEHFLHIHFFVCPCLFKIKYHDIFHVMSALCFDSSAPNLHTSILCLTYNTSDIIWSYFITLGLFTCMDVLSDIEMLSVSTSGVYAISILIIYLYCFCLSHLTANVYKLLMFS